MINFLNPSAFYGLLALVVPTIILLLSKQKQQVIEFGSLVFLETSESKTARKVFPTEWLLFFLRVAIISLIVLLLAEPITVKNENEKRILIDKKVYNDPEFKDVLESLGEEIEVIDPLSWSVLINSLNEKSDSVVVYSRSYLKDFSDASVMLNSNVDWRIVPVEEDFLAIDSVNLKDIMYQLSISSGEQGLNWKKEKIPWNGEMKSEPIGIRLLASKDKIKEKDKLQVMLISYENVLPLTFSFESDAPTWTIIIDTLISEPTKKMMTWTRFIGPLSINSLLAEVHEIGGELSAENLSNSNFPLDLAYLFLYDLLELNKIDRRILVPEERSESVTVLNANVQTKEIKYIWVIVMFLLLMERWINRKSVSA